MNCNTLNQHIQKYLDKESKRKDSIRRSKKKYKEEKCSSLNLSIEKALLDEFREKCKELGISQTSVISKFLKDFVK